MRAEIPSLLLAAVLTISVAACSEDRSSSTEDAGAPTSTEAARAQLPPLLAAIAADDAESAAALLARGEANADEQEVWSDALIDVGIDIEPGVRITVPPLAVAVFLSRFEVAAVLVDHGASVDVRVPGDVTPLLIAIYEDDADSLAWLLERGADVDFAAEPGRRPLHVAIEERRLEIVGRLLDAGANASAPDAEGLTPMSAALAHGDMELVELLQRHGVPFDAGDPARAIGHIDTVGEDPTWTKESQQRRRPLGIAVDPRGGWLYWSEYRTGRIARIPLSGEGRRELVTGDTHGPIGLALSPAGDRLYWTSDDSYPRSVRALDLASGTDRTIIAGPPLNRPRDITATAETVFWSETISGRIRRVAADARVAVPTDIVTDELPAAPGLSGYEPFFVVGLDVDPAAERLYWSEQLDAVIESATFAGEDRRRHFGREHGVVFPVGVAVDTVNRQLYWADVAREVVLRAALDGGNPEVVVDAADGLIEPRAVAIDAAGGFLYWTDATRDAIGRARLDGERVAWLDLGREDGSRFVAVAADPVDCAKQLRSSVDRFRRRIEKRAATCLEAVDAAKALKRREDDARFAVPVCVDQLAALARGRGERFLEPWRGDDRRDCTVDPAEVLRGCGVAEPGCAALDCAMDACRRAAWLAVGRRHRRAREWIEEVRPFVAATASTGDVAAADARDVLAEIEAALPSDRMPPAPWGTLPATGLRTSYRAALSRAETLQRVPDDGRVRAGAPLRFRDNGDGTISDLTTGLMWEKKVDQRRHGHDYLAVFPWTSNGSEPTIWDWVGRLNREGGTGFAGYSDWRIPNIKELQSIVDYERFNPAATRDFDGGRCGLACDDIESPECSCTALRAYWSSTTSVDWPAHALVVSFNLGLIGDLEKKHHAAVRAVRGGLPDAGL